ncbi:MAG: M43 family zinc metalloprotease [Bacteroidota bacterium]
MRKQTSQVILLTVIAVTAIYGQNPPLQSCYFDAWAHSVQAHQPAAYAAYEALYERAVVQSAQPEARSGKPDYTIPVVVHNLWREEQEYLSEERILSQIEVLNRDFGRRNADTTELRAVFGDWVGRPNIAFELEHIVRVNTDTSFRLDFNWANFQLQYPDYIKQSARGGSDAWDTERYLNIWVGNIEDDALFGYAYPPSGFAEWPTNLQPPAPELDGVVVHYKAFGATPPPIQQGHGQLYQPLGRTATHEVGHYLGLQHPWGLDPLNLDCLSDDGLEDTPLTQGYQPFRCDHTKNSCVDHPVDWPDMIENFMDYSDEACKNTFTARQVQLMHYVLDNYRPQLRKKSVNISDRSPLRVYPNPTRGRLQVFVNPEKPEDYRLRIISSSSKVISLPVSSYPESNFAHYQLNLSSLPNGVYFVEFTSERRRLSQKVLLMR